LETSLKVRLHVGIIALRLSISFMALFSPPLPIHLLLGSGRVFFFPRIPLDREPAIEFILSLLYQFGTPLGFLLKLLSPSPAQNSHIPPNLVISNLITPNAAWNLPLITSLFDPTSVREIQKIKIHPNPSSNPWTPSPNGNFSTKSAYKLISSQRPPLLPPS
jgi:hypothetical protein